jgi:hypothetical protein
MGGYYTYPVGRIAVEAAVFDSQDPDPGVHDRSTLAALHGQCKSSNTALYPGQEHRRTEATLWSVNGGQ